MFTALKLAALARQVLGSDAASGTCIVSTSRFVAEHHGIEMSIHFSGTLSRSGGLISAVIKQLKKVNLMPVKRIVFHFDPFDNQCKETRLVP